MSEYTVEVDALRAFATGTEGRVQELEEQRAAMSATALSRGDFGYVPGVGSRLDAVYEDLAEACFQAVTAQIMTAADIADSIRTAALIYHDMDHRAAAGSQRVEDQLPGGHP